ncbi:MAG: hypothetical protein KC620_08385 [Myxococcales bacterium]|nr:hypothetical protein [Myxococcales bacterium]
MADAIDDLVGRLVLMLADGRAVANLGLRDGVRVGDRFAVFDHGEEVMDPETGESLGVLEQVKTHLIAEHVQPRLVQLRDLTPDEPAQLSTREVLSARLAATSGHSTRPEPRRKRSLKVGDGVRRVTSPMA